MDSGNTQMGLQNPSTTSSNVSNPHSLSHLPGRVRKVTSSCTTSKRHASKTSDRRSTNKHPRLLQSYIRCGEGIWGLETSNRLIDSKSMGLVSQISNGNNKVNSDINNPRSIDEFNRPDRRIFPHTSTSSVKTTTTFCTPRENSTIQSPPLWTVDQPKNLHQNYETGGGFRSSTRCKTTPIPGRLATDSRQPSNSKTTDRMAPTALQSLRPSSKPCQIITNPIATDNISGYSDRHQIESSEAIRKTKIKADTPDINIFISSSPYSIRVATNNGTPNILRENSSQRTYQDKTITMATEVPLETKSGPNVQKNTSITRMSHLPTMVGRQQKPNVRCTTSTNTDRSPPLFGRIIQRVGDTHGWFKSIRDMEPCHTTTTYKHTGTSCSMVGNESIPTTNMQQNCSDNVRQHNNSSIHKKRGGDKVEGNVRSDTEATTLVRRAQCDNGPKTHSGTHECIGRSIEPKGTSSKNRMELESCNVQQNMPNIGQTTDRSVCHETKHKITNLHIADTRPTSMESRCSYPVVEQSGCLCISTNHTDTSMPEQGKIRERRSDSDCTKLAKPGMVYRHIGPSGPKANQTTALKNTSETNILTQVSPEPGNVRLTRVEAICEQTQKRGFSEAVSKRIATPHRNSTSKLYESKWNVFKDWCKQRKIDPLNPTVPDIADFLLHLFEIKNLSVTTIQGYRSAISSLVAASGLDITNNKELSMLIKNFFNEKPIIHREVPRWDLQVLLRLRKSGDAGFCRVWPKIKNFMLGSHTLN